VRIRAKAAYDGTDFLGFQKQAGDARTVQGEIETALGKVIGQHVAVLAAGRTDTGVHATGQVIVFDVDWAHSLDALKRAINVNLPEDVAVRELVECEPGFHPRYSAVSRMYEYSAYVDDVRQPLMRRFAWLMERAPDVALMNEAAGALIGEHDFAAFGTPPSARPDETTVRKVMRADWRWTNMQAQDRLVFTIEANAFLFRMVRRIVIALARVGFGQISPDELREILGSKDAQRIKGLAPACGLCLVDVKY
jgi:tRNA pseudouridine38-40 synthase